VAHISISNRQDAGAVALALALGPARSLTIVLYQRHLLLACLVEGTLL
jgi:hypothetical protein